MNTEKYKSERLILPKNNIQYELSKGSTFFNDSSSDDVEPQLDSGID